MYGFSKSVKLELRHGNSTFYDEEVKEKKVKYFDIKFYPGMSCSWGPSWVIHLLNELLMMYVDKNTGFTRFLGYTCTLSVNVI